MWPRVGFSFGFCSEMRFEMRLDFRASTVTLASDIRDDFLESGGGGGVAFGVVLGIFTAFGETSGIVSSTLSARPSSVEGSNFDTSCTFYTVAENHKE